MEGPHSDGSESAAKSSEMGGWEREVPRLFPPTLRSVHERGGGPCLLYGPEGDCTMTTTTERVGRAVMHDALGDRRG